VNAPDDWWRTFFSGLIVEMWQKVTTEAMTKEEADFVAKMLAVRPPARLLDVPCGAGRHCLALAARGYQMTGVDISTQLLEAARAKAAGRPEKVTWEQRDMRDLPWPQTFDGAFSLGNSFGYYDDAGNAAFLKAVAAVLKPGARYLLDASYILETILPTLQERTWWQLDDVLTLADRRYDPARTRLEVEYTLIRGAQVEKRAMSARLYSVREVCRLLEEAGFSGLQTYGSFALEPFKLRSERLLVVATRSTG
jgi:SAM-dependent methyltransferase